MAVVIRNVLGPVSNSGILDLYTAAQNYQQAGQTIFGRFGSGIIHSYIYM